MGKCCGFPDFLIDNSSRASVIDAGNEDNKDATHLINILYADVFELGLLYTRLDTCKRAYDFPGL